MGPGRGAGTRRALGARGSARAGAAGQGVGSVLVVSGSAVRARCARDARAMRARCAALVQRLRERERKCKRMRKRVRDASRSGAQAHKRGQGASPDLPRARARTRPARGARTHQSMTKNLSVPCSGVHTPGTAASVAALVEAQ